jgi:ABC-type Zn uptake system ZnuABC Zn-binding protein ZnuA
MHFSRTILAFTLLIGLLSVAAAQAKVNVVTSITPLASLVDSVGGDLVKVDSIGRANEDPHFVEVRPSFLMTIAKAQLYVSIGMSLDFWAKPMIENSRNTSIVTVNASQGIHVLGLPTERVSALLGDVHPEGNPHYWVDPYTIPVVVKNIVSGLSSVDPTHKETYQKNAQAFLEKLKKKAAEWEKRMLPFKHTKIVTYHESWEYFTERFGLDAVAQVEPKPGIPPSGAHTQEVIEIIGRDHVQVILQEPYYSDSTSKFIAEKTKAKLLKLPQLTGALPGTEDYISMIEYNVSQIETALRK